MFLCFSDVRSHASASTNVCVPPQTVTVSVSAKRAFCGEIRAVMPAGTVTVSAIFPPPRFHDTAKRPASVMYSPSAKVSALRKWGAMVISCLVYSAAVWPMPSSVLWNHAMGQEYMW